MRIAITGGTGFVGGHLAAALSTGGHDVVVLARGVDRRPWARQVALLPGVTFARVSLEDPVGLAEAFQRCDAVAHCAGVPARTALRPITSPSGRPRGSSGRRVRAGPSSSPG